LELGIGNSEFGMRASTWKGKGAEGRRGGGNALLVTMIMRYVDPTAP
jgi:hypothetical protein